MRQNPSFPFLFFNSLILLGFAFSLAILDLPAAQSARSLASALTSAPSVIVGSTYLDGSGYQFGWDRAWVSATDAAGNVYVAGDTQEPGFPATSGAVQTNFGAGGQDGFVAKFDRNGNLLWSTFLGGSDWDGVFGLTVDSAGNAVV